MVSGFSGCGCKRLEGGKITYSQSFIRNISKIHPLFLLLDWLIGIATPGDRRQKYSDRMAGTVVFRRLLQPFASVAPPPPPSSQ